MTAEVAFPVTRRQFGVISAGLVSSLIGGGRRVHAEARTAPFPIIADISENCSRDVGKLAAIGVKVVFRYYALELQPALPTKRLSKAEADTILGQGLSLAIAYQFNNDKLTTFTADRGKKDADLCLNNGLNVIQQPKGSAIYFGVDGDWPDAARFGKVVTYFETINRAFGDAGNAFEVGVYGSGATCRELKRRGLATHFWMAGSTGWSGTPGFYNEGSWTLYQSDLELPVGSIRIDSNILNPKIAKIGSFSLGGKLDDNLDNKSVFESRRFVKRSGVKLLNKPGAEVKRTLKARQIVTALSTSGAFTEIEATFPASNSGRSAILRGYCETASLSAIDKMPG